MNDFGFLYFRDKDTGEYKLLGKTSGMIAIDEAPDDMVDEGPMISFRNSETITFASGPSKIIDTTAREIEEGDKIRGLRASANVIEDFPFLEDEE